MLPAVWCNDQPWTVVEMLMDYSFFIKTNMQILHFWLQVTWESYTYILLWKILSRSIFYCVLHTNFDAFLLASLHIPQPIVSLERVYFYIFNFQTTLSRALPILFIATNRITTAIISAVFVQTSSIFYWH